MSNEQTFPIMQEFPASFFAPQRPSIPWAMIAPHDAQARRNHAEQSLTTLARRGGLSAEEAVAILEDKDYRDRWPRTDGTRAAQDARTNEAIRALDALVEAYEKAHA